MASHESSFPGGGARRDEESALRDLVEKYRIYWQVWPERVQRGAERIQTGYRIGLLGTHGHAEKSPVEACPECWKVFRGLCSLAHWLMPQGEQECDYQMRIADAIFLRSPDR